MTVKPGYKTTEFWFTLVSFIFSGLYLIGVINDNSQKEELIGNVSHAVESCILIGGQLAILWKYINSRNEVKKSYLSTQEPSETEETEVVNDDNSNNSKPKSNKTRSRKSNSSSKRKANKRTKTSNKRSVENSTNRNSRHNSNNRKAGN